MAMKGSKLSALILVFSLFYNCKSPSREQQERMTIKQYLDVEDIYIDYKKRHILLLDNGKNAVITYDIDGHFVCIDKISYYAYAFYPMADKYFLLNYAQNKLKNNLILVDKETQEITNGFLPTQMNLPVINSNNFFEETIGKVFFHFPYNDMIYKLNNDGLKAYLEIDFGKYKNPINMQSANFFDFIKTQEYVGGIHAFYAYREHLFFSFYKYNGTDRKIDLYHSYVSMSNQKAIVYNYGLKHNEKLPISPLPEIIGLSEGTLIYQINPNILEENLIEKINRSELIKDSDSLVVSSEDNPILVLYELISNRY